MNPENIKMNTKKTITAFVHLGSVINDYLLFDDEFKKLGAKDDLRILHEAVVESSKANPWFIRENIHFSLRNIASTLTEEKLQSFLSPYITTGDRRNSPKKVGVVMAGNIPLVGFHDFLCVLLSGNQFVGKLSSDDNKLIPAFGEILINNEPSLASGIRFCESKLTNFEAVIATGSSNTSRYFEYYFGKYPHIIRKSRNGVAVLNGNESDEDLAGLADDIFSYFGQGCRNVSKIFIPENVEPDFIMKGFGENNSIIYHNKYNNNYDYYKSIYLINSIKFFDFNTLLLTEETAFSSPISVIYFERYNDLDSLKTYLDSQLERIQCIVTNERIFEDRVAFGKSQMPELHDFADGVDTMAFLMDLA